MDVIVVVAECDEELDVGVIEGMSAPGGCFRGCANVESISATRCRFVVAVVCEDECGESGEEFRPRFCDGVSRAVYDAHRRSMYP